MVDCAIKGDFGGAIQDTLTDTGDATGTVLATVSETHSAGHVELQSAELPLPRLQKYEVDRLSYNTPQSR